MTDLKRGPETLYDGPSVLANMREIDNRLPITSKLEPPLIDLRSLVKHRWSDMLPQTRKGIESAIASLEAALVAERDHARRHLVDHAARGEVGPKRILRAVE